MPASTLARFQRITPQQLRAFEASARLLSVTRAAKELCVSQPTVSVQLRELASTLGEPLFQQHGRSIQLTQAGEALYGTVRELAACWQRLESRLADIHGLVRGRLKLAAVTTAEYFVPDMLGSFAAAHPGVDIELAIENRDRVVGRLEQGLDDLVVMMMPPEHLPLASLEFQTNPLVVIAPAAHRLARQALTLQDLAQERWLLREPGSGTRMAAEQHFKKQRFEPAVAMSLGSNEAIKHAVAAGLGIAVLSRLAIFPPLWPAAGSSEVAAFKEPLTMLQVDGFPLSRHWYVVWRNDHPLSAAARHFLQYLEAKVETT